MGTQSSPTVRSSRRKMYAAVSAVAVVTILLASLVLAPPGESMELNIYYNVGEGMVYQTTGSITSAWVNTSLGSPDSTMHSYNVSINKIKPIIVLGESDYVYSVNVTQVNTLADLENHPLYQVGNVSKNPCETLLIGYAAPLLFFNVTNNPTLAAYYNKTSVRTGDVWTLQLSGNTSMGLVGQVTITFAGIQTLTVPAGTFRTMRIEISSNVLTYDANGPSPVIRTKDMTLQFNGTTYLEQSTCRLIKADYSQITTSNAPGINSTGTLHSEETLIQYTKP
jgi:hypothetical protein